jgi:hypothetical protein
MKKLKKLFEFFTGKNSEYEMVRIAESKATNEPIKINSPIKIPIEKTLNQSEASIKANVVFDHAENEDKNPTNPILQTQSAKKIEESKSILHDLISKMIKESDKNQMSIYNSSDKSLELFDINKVNLNEDFLTNFKLPKIDESIMSKPPSDKAILNRKETPN